MRDYSLPDSPLQFSDEVVEEFPVAALFNSGVNFVHGLWNDITGKSSQAKEFEQQEYLLEKEQSYNSEVAKMARMKQAGINPLTAAAGIAGSNSPLAPQVSSNTSGVAQGLGALTGGLDSLASAKKLNEEANQVAPLAQSSIETSTAQIERWSHENGFDDVQTEALIIDNETRSDRNRAELNIKIQQHENMKKEGDYIQAQKDYLERQIKWYDEQIAAEIDLTQKRALEAEKNAMLAEERKKTEMMENDFAEKHGYRRDLPFDSAMLSLWFSGDYDKVLAAEKYMFGLKYGESYSIENARQQAEVDFTYEKYKEQYRAEEIYKRADNPYALAQRILDFDGDGGSNTWVERLFAIDVNGDVKQYRQQLDDVIDGLTHQLDVETDPDLKEMLFAELKSLQQVRNLPKRELMRFMNMRSKSTKETH